MKRRAVVVVVLLLVVAIVGLALAYVYLWSGRNAGQTAVVRRGNLSSTVNTLGQAQARRQVSLSTQASGRVKGIPVREGDRVEQGALLLAVRGEAHELQEGLAWMVKQGVEVEVLAESGEGQ